MTRAAGIAAECLTDEGIGPKSSGNNDGQDHLGADAPRLPEVRSLDAVLGDVLEYVESGRPLVKTLRTGLVLLDESMGGMVCGEFLGIAAAPGLGKTMLADRMTLGTLRNQPDATAVVFNLETATAIRVARLVCGEAITLGPQNQIDECIPLGAILRGELNDTGKARVRATGDRMKAEFGDRLAFVDSEYCARSIAAVIRARRPSIAVVDHCGLVVASWLHGGSTVDQFDAVLHALNDAIREVDAAGVFIAELTKQSLSAGVADLGSVRGSARFASLAGALLTIRTDDDDQAGDDPVLRLEVHKARRGQSRVFEGATLFGGLGHMSLSGHVERIHPKRRQGQHP